MKIDPERSSVRRMRPLVRLTLSAMFLALCMLLPFLTGNVPKIGNMLCPMHIPVLLCGIICGWQYGLAVGLIAPLLRFALFSAPPLYPMGISMAFELAVYGAVIGLVYSRLKNKNTAGVYLSLVSAMVCGRIVWGTVRFVLARMTGGEFTWEAYLSGALLTAIPGIICQLVLIPLIIASLRRYKAIE